MEYINYILIMLGIIAVCLALVHFSGRTYTRLEIHRHSRVVRDTTPPANELVVLKSKTLVIPTPWGWPGHDGQAEQSSHGSAHHPPGVKEVEGVSGSLSRFTDRLFKEKRTVENSEYLLRKDASLRAMIEDRYSPASKAHSSRHRKAASESWQDMDQQFEWRTLKDVKTPWGW